MGSHWERKGDGVLFAFVVPPNARATIRIPKEAGTTALFNNKPLTSAPELNAKALPEGGWQFDAVAGRYSVVTAGAR